MRLALSCCTPARGGGSQGHQGVSVRRQAWCSSSMASASAATPRRARRKRLMVSSSRKREATRVGEVDSRVRKAAMEAASSQRGAEGASAAFAAILQKK